ncbi:MAG: formyltetrahydrofolate deformylase [Candidatus Omnitrophica bacterium]|nr:formyltetrahydrofolate deformylase [Candidatus Omnitrophota bacterium]MDD5488647.1 formyltetrahydrofolate deformylase [Candidatus Omnitrophota bacterium]
MVRAILLISCPDKKGITATITDFVYKNKGNILHAEQHTDEYANTFFMRVEWSMDGFTLARDKVGKAFAPIARKFGMEWDLFFTDRRIRMAIFVSKHLHCLYDLLLRHKSGQIDCDIPVIISNHKDACSVAREFGVEFHHIPVSPRSRDMRQEEQLKLLKDKKVDLVVLARYMQILPSAFVDRYRNRIINIHHSFLPAFAGKNPYLQAYLRGVKIIGATSHYVTEDLDDGPIIEQNTVPISHRDSLKDLIIEGQDLEKVVLSRAVMRHIERKVLVYDNKTVVFD